MIKTSSSMVNPGRVNKDLLFIAGGFTRNVPFSNCRKVEKQSELQGLIRDPHFAGVNPEHARSPDTWTNRNATKLCFPLMVNEPTGTGDLPKP